MFHDLSAESGAGRSLFGTDFRGGFVSETVSRGGVCAGGDPGVSARIGSERTGSESGASSAHYDHYSGNLPGGSRTFLQVRLHAGRLSERRQPADDGPVDRQRSGLLCLAGAGEDPGFRCQNGPLRTSFRTSGGGDHFLHGAGAEVQRCQRQRGAAHRPDEFFGDIRPECDLSPGKGHDLEDLRPALRCCRPDPAGITPVFKAGRDILQCGA